MGYLPEPTPEMGEYHVEVRRGSFYLKGEHNYAWVRELKNGRRKTPSGELTMLHGQECEIRDDPSKPRGDGWMYICIPRRHAIVVYPEINNVNQGNIEILIEDIPKIRAALDQVERHLEGIAE